ncbi:MAG: hypothetical protein H0V12_07360 [Chloroflexi bacterium]|nr:hypothetical protein [Chloroflexota bacterium]
MSLLRSLRANVSPLFFEETRVSRYVVLGDSAVGITAPGQAPGVVGSQWAPRFDAPGIVPGAHAVIYFGAKPETEAATFSVRLTRSPEHLMIHKFTDGSPHSWHQIIRPHVLTEVDNELIFNVSSDGRVTFSDVVILYTSDRLTISKPPVIKQ